MSADSSNEDDSDDEEEPKETHDEVSLFKPKIIKTRLNPQAINYTHILFAIHRGLRATARPSKYK